MVSCKISLKPIQSIEGWPQPWTVPKGPSGPRLWPGFFPSDSWPALLEKTISQWLAPFLTLVPVVIYIYYIYIYILYIYILYIYYIYILYIYISPPWFATSLFTISYVPFLHPAILVCSISSTTLVIKHGTGKPAIHPWFI